ncbi:MAG TPA: hypothetical protein PLQ93_02275 [Bacteroidia bacterium]|nr:hypothetical protein [Bacteroidia bacterium]
MKVKQIILLTISGTLFRLVFAWQSHIWNMAHDQIVWSLSLQDMVSNSDFDYKHLIHYPYEGGTVPISLLALLFIPFLSFVKSLSAAALVCDTLIRYLQIRIAERIFGATTAFWFACWTILAVPEMLPWGTSFFGLHYVNSIVLFLFLYACVRQESKLTRPVRLALVAGLGIVFSYHNIILLPAYLIWLLMQESTLRQKARDYMLFLLTMLPILALHGLVRVFADPGFHLEELALISPRDESWRESFQHGFVNFVSAWYQALPASFLVSAGNLMSSSAQRWLVFAFLVAALAVLFLNRDKNPGTLLAGLIILFFMASYAFSIFFTDRIDVKTFYLYRHFSYVIPLIVLLALHVYKNIPGIHAFMRGGFILFCGFFSVLYTLQFNRIPEPEYKIAGWILARKYGDDVSMLNRIRSVAPEKHHNELSYGYGWGMAAHLLRDKTEQDTTAVTTLCRLYRQFPEAQKPLVEEGIRFAFLDWVTPTLEPQLLNKFEACKDKPQHQTN